MSNQQDYETIILSRLAEKLEVSLSDLFFETRLCRFNSPKDELFSRLISGDLFEIELVQTFKVAGTKLYQYSSVPLINNLEPFVFSLPFCLDEDE